MSSSHIIIVARNTETGDIEFPLGKFTLYGTGGEENILQIYRKSYGEDWILSMYAPIGSEYTTSAEARLREALERIAADHDCDCKPCMGQCRSEESLRITVGEMRDIARSALSAVGGEAKKSEGGAGCCNRGSTAQGKPLKAIEPSAIGSVGKVTPHPAGVAPGPSDQTADVTVEEISDLLREDGINSTIARLAVVKLFRKFTVGRR